MKTIDEVIIGINYLFWKKGYDDKQDILSDAVSYLKEYKKVTDVCHKHGIKSVFGIKLPNPEKANDLVDFRGIDGYA